MKMLEQKIKYQKIKKLNQQSLFNLWDNIK